MTFALLAALIFQTLSCLWLLHAKDERAADMLETQRQVTFDLIGAERVMHRAEIQALCQRLQAPEAAVIQYQQEQAGDESPYPLSDAESAQAQDRSKWIAEIERMENEGVLS